MEGTNQAPTKAVFGAYEVDLRSGELLKQGVRVKLQEQPFKVLAALVAHPGELARGRNCAV
ncbi:MAG TPA: hypothetical protein VEI52_25010 [Terriglobales bacterium]|nr:hypothetical protein [Terriglobales bacterium]